VVDFVEFLARKKEEIPVTIQVSVDRHKWLFSLSEAPAFFEAQQAFHALRLIDTVVTEKPRLAAVPFARRLRYPRQLHYLNSHAHTLWALFEKRGFLSRQRTRRRVNAISH
jgi:hypothetical protein